jgi:hypothetical protein
MHTTEVGFQGHTLRAIHHGDWSGSATVILPEGDNILATLHLEGDLVLRFALEIARPLAESLFERMFERFMDVITDDDDSIIKIWRKGT